MPEDRGKPDLLRRLRDFLRPERGLARTRVKALCELPPERRLPEVGAALHEACVKAAARFVEEEHRRADSPFRDLPKTDLFHELLVINFWVLEWLLRGKRPELLEEVLRQYNASFVWGLESSHKELAESMRGKFRTYGRAWDEYSGHQDVFARQAIGIVFGERGCAAPQQAAFWLISHADRTMKELAPLVASAGEVLGGTAPRS